MMTLQRLPMPLYALLAGAKSSAGRRNPSSQRRISAPIDGAFLVPVSYGGCAWADFGLAGFLCDRFPTPRTVATQSRRKDRGDSNHKGVTPMAQLRLSNLITRSLSSRAAAHRAMAKAALFADSSASTRLKRYNHHIDKAHQLEARTKPTNFTVHLAHTGERLEIVADTWQEALRSTGRADACIIEQADDRKVDVTFDPDAPTLITCRLRHGTPAEVVQWALANVVHNLEQEAKAFGTGANQ